MLSHMKDPFLASNNTVHNPEGQRKLILYKQTFEHKR